MKPVKDGRWPRDDINNTPKSPMSIERQFADAWSREGIEKRRYQSFAQFDSDRFKVIDSLLKTERAPGEVRILVDLSQQHSSAIIGRLEENYKSAVEEQRLQVELLNETVQAWWKERADQKAAPNFQKQTEELEKTVDELRKQVEDVCRERDELKSRVTKETNQTQAIIFALGEHQKGLEAAKAESNRLSLELKSATDRLSTTRAEYERRLELGARERQELEDQLHESSSTAHDDLEELRVAIQVAKDKALKEKEHLKAELLAVSDERSTLESRLVEVMTAAEGQALRAREALNEALSNTSRADAERERAQERAAEAIQELDKTKGELEVAKAQGEQQLEEALARMEMMEVRLRDAEDKVLDEQGSQEFLVSEWQLKLHLSENARQKTEEQLEGALTNLRELYDRLSSAERAAEEATGRLRGQESHFQGVVAAEWQLKLQASENARQKADEQLEGALAKLGEVGERVRAAEKEAEEATGRLKDREAQSEDLLAKANALVAEKEASLETARQRLEHEMTRAAATEAEETSTGHPSQEHNKETDETIQRLERERDEMRTAVQASKDLYTALESEHSRVSNLLKGVEAECNRVQSEVQHYRAMLEDATRRLEAAAKREKMAEEAALQDALRSDELHNTVLMEASEKRRLEARVKALEIELSEVIREHQVAEERINKSMETAETNKAFIVIPSSSVETLAPVMPIKPSMSNPAAASAITKSLVAGTLKSPAVKIPNKPSEIRAFNKEAAKTHGGAKTSADDSLKKSSSLKKEASKTGIADIENKPSQQQQQQPLSDARPLANIAGNVNSTATLLSPVSGTNNTKIPRLSLSPRATNEVPALKLDPITSQGMGTLKLTMPTGLVPSAGTSPCTTPRSLKDAVPVITPRGTITSKIPRPGASSALRKSTEVSGIPRPASSSSNSNPRKAAPLTAPSSGFHTPRSTPSSLQGPSPPCSPPANDYYGSTISDAVDGLSTEELKSSLALANVNFPGGLDLDREFYVEAYKTHVLASNGDAGYE